MTLYIFVSLVHFVSLLSWCGLKCVKKQGTRIAMTQSVIESILVPCFFFFVSLKKKCNLVSLLSWCDTFWYFFLLLHIYHGVVETRWNFIFTCFFFLPLWVSVKFCETSFSSYSCPLIFMYNNNQVIYNQWMLCNNQIV